MPVKSWRSNLWGLILTIRIQVIKSQYSRKSKDFVLVGAGLFKIIFAIMGCSAEQSYENAKARVTDKPEEERDGYLKGWNE